MYPKAIDSGLAISEFWELSIPEVRDAIESMERRVKLELSHKFFLAQSIAEHVGLYLNNENKARQLWDFFPELFQKEKAEYEEIENKAAVAKAVENRKRYAAEIKRRREMGIL